MIDGSAVSAIGGLLRSVLTFFGGRQSAAKNDGKEAGALAKDIEYLKDSADRQEGRLDRIELTVGDNVKRLEGRIDEQSVTITQISQLAAEANQRAKSAHRRVDEHLEREHGQKVVRPPE